MPTLTVHNAEIRTATVEVKTLAMSGKQVTLAVFRQLRERDLLNDDGTLNGQPWGVVNYHPDKCADADAHVHVVWQSGSDLYRDRVYLTETYPRWIEAEAATAWVDAKVRDDALHILTGWKATAEEFLKTFLGVAVRMSMSHEAQMVTLARTQLERLRRELATHGPSHLVYAPGGERSVPVTASGLAAAREAARYRNIPVAEAVAAAEEQFEKALAVLPTTPLAQTEVEMVAQVRAEADRRRRRRDARTALANLPQLFIAV